MKSFRIVFMALTVVLVALAASAQERGNARLFGKVVDEQKQPVPDVQVRVTMVGAPGLWTGKTDKKGEWRINGLADGRYLIEFAKEGLQGLKNTFEIVDERVPAINVTMAKPAVDPTIEINAQLQHAVELAQKQQYADARKICEDLLVKVATLTQCHGFIGRMYAAEGQAAKGVDHVKTAIQQEPDNVDHKLLLADLMMETGDKAEAKKILDGIDMTKVKDPFPFINVAIGLINDKKGQDAVDLLTKLLAQFPSQNEIYYYRGRANLSAEKIDDAKADLEKFVSLSPTAKEAADAKKILEQIKK